MKSVRVFPSTGRFGSFEAVRRFIDQTCSDDGDAIASPFMLETGLRSFEPMCIEAHCNDGEVALRQLLSGASFGEEWIAATPAELRCDAAICVFPPNRLETPQRSSLVYVGAFAYDGGLDL